MTQISVKAVCTSDPDEPPQESCKDQFLFLLEIYVEYIDSRRLAKLNEMFLLPTTVMFSFLDFEMDEDNQITPVDPTFQPQSGMCTDVEIFNSGRSVLFALGQEYVFEMAKEFKIDFKVGKKMPRDIRPDIYVGCGEIDLSTLFTALRKELIEKTRYKNADIPDPMKTLETEVPLYFEECVMGCMKTFVRISSFGQTIVTAIEPPDLERKSASSFLFKGTDDVCEDKNINYKCRRFDPLNCELSGLLREESSTRSKKDNCMACNPPKLPCAPCRVNSGAQIKGKSIIPQAAPIMMSPCLPQSCGQLPQSCGQGDTRGKYEPLPPDPCRGPAIQTSRGPKEPCGKAVVLKVSGLLDAGEENLQPTVTVTGEDEAITQKELEDPDHDIFVLRIGKKGIVGAGEKSDIQLEMRTPKGPERRPPVRLETREIQTEDHGHKKSNKKKK